ncbi:universal stress protein [Patulibacter sp. NPDC049589]|uniref:universal stress protein n=1 Tax=Patulibacter sp. NPDC049589 TaxID=3154731 RepID=UPI00342F9807
MRHHFIVGFDGTAGGSDALALATTLADAVPQDAVEITVASITPLHPRGRGVPGAGAGHADAVRDAAEERLRAARDACADRPGVSFVVRAATSPAHGLQLLAAELGARAIVVGRSHTGPLGRTFVGSATEQTLHGAGCPVAVAPVGYAAEQHEIATVAVAYDGSDSAAAALTFATRLARDRDAVLRLVRVNEPLPMAYGGMVAPYPVATLREDAQATLDDAAGRVVGLAVETSLLDGSAVHALSQPGAGADLLVVGSRDFGPVGRILLGAVGARLSRHCPTPLIVVPRDAAATSSAAATGAEVASVS